MIEGILKDIEGKGGRCHFGHSDTGDFKFLCFSTNEMKVIRDLNTFPDTLIMDASYKIDNFLHPILSILCIDQEGNERLVCHTYLLSEDTEILSLCLQYFHILFDANKCNTFSY